jgi:hypothetical protein
MSRGDNTRRDAYVSAALDRACAAIIAAPKRSQEATLHREVFSIGGLIDDGFYRHAVAKLVSAAQRMPAYEERWTGLQRKVEASLKRGMTRPRRLPKGNWPSAIRARCEPLPERPPESVSGTTTASALALWAEGVDPRWTPAEAYWRSRSLSLDDLSGCVLRWHAGQHALLALFRNIETDQPQAISRTFLDQNAQKIGRKFLGPVAGAAVKLDDDDTVTHGLYVAEGIETAQAARQLGLKPAWAMGSAGAIARLPPLSGIECLSLLAEHCPENARAVEACGTRWRNAGREVFLVEPSFGKDLNDAIKGKATHPTKESGLS